MHPRIDQRDWMRVLSRYRGVAPPVLQQQRWRPAPGGPGPPELPRAPADVRRRGPAGDPAAQPGSVVAVERLLDAYGVGVCYENEEDLLAQLRDRAGLRELQASAW